MLDHIASDLYISWFLLWLLARGDLCWTSLELGLLRALDGVCIDDIKAQMLSLRLTEVECLSVLPSEQDLAEAFFFVDNALN